MENKRLIIDDIKKVGAVLHGIPYDTENIDVPVNKLANLNNRLKRTEEKVLSREDRYNEIIRLEVEMQLENKDLQTMRAEFKVADKIKAKELAGEITKQKDRIKKLQEKIRKLKDVQMNFRKPRRRSPSVLIPVEKPGSLSSLGYAIHDIQSVRHKALTKAVKKYGFQPVMAKVNLLYVYNMRRYPDIASRAEADKKWLHKTYYTGRKAVRSSRKAVRSSRKAVRSSRKAVRSSRKAVRSSRKAAVKSHVTKVQKLRRKLMVKRNAVLGEIIKSKMVKGGYTDPDKRSERKVLNVSKKELKSAIEKIGNDVRRLNRVKNQEAVKKAEKEAKKTLKMYSKL